MEIAMTKILARILALALVAPVLAGGMSLAQQGPATGRNSFGETPGVASGTTGTTYGTPGNLPISTTPGGTIPMAAGTQDTSKAPSALPNFNNSLSPTSPSTGAR
jgi:hypothetical protein